MSFSSYYVFILSQLRNNYKSNTDAIFNFPMFTSPIFTYFLSFRLTESDIHPTLYFPAVLSPILNLFSTAPMSNFQLM